MVFYVRREAKGQAATWPPRFCRGEALAALNIARSLFTLDLTGDQTQYLSEADRSAATARESSEVDQESVSLVPHS
jgi:hypothetical protein